MSLLSAEEPPSKAQRQLCYDARDKYWKCLDDNASDSDSICKQARKTFEASCLARWVEHFDKKYRFEKWKIEQEAELKKSNAEAARKQK